MTSEHVLLTPTPKFEVDGKTFVLARLSISTAFKLVRLITAIGTGQAIKAVQEIMENMKNEPDDHTKSVAAVAVILENISSAEKEFNELGAKLLDVETKEFSSLPFDVLPKLFVAIKAHPDLENFLKSVEGLLEVQK